MGFTRSKCRDVELLSGMREIVGKRLVLVTVLENISKLLSTHILKLEDTAFVIENLDKLHEHISGSRTCNGSLMLFGLAFAFAFNPPADGVGIGSMRTFVAGGGSLFGVICPG